MRINSFTGETEVREGQTVTLYCTSPCTFHQLEVSWFRDGHQLSESGPTLRLGPLTAKDFGNYTCASKTNINTHSQPYSLFVEATEEVLFDQLSLSDCPFPTSLAADRFYQQTAMHDIYAIFL